jgi:hypothetical protein
MSKLLSVRLGTLVLVFSLVLIPVGARADTTCTETWSETRPPDTFTEGLTKSQGVTTDGHSWIFSWQGGLERTNDAYTTQAVATWPRPLIVNNPKVKANGTNHLINTHFGDVDYYQGKIYAPFEDGSEGPINNPDYQHPYIAVYHSKGLDYTGTHFELPLSLQFAGVPWVAIDAANQVAYTAEWDMPHDRINVYNLMFKNVGFINLHYPADLGANFHLSRIQGAKVYNGALYASRDDDAKTIFKIDLATGDVTKLFSLNPTEPAELEGLSIRPMPDGTLLHVIEVLDNDTSDPQTLSKIHVEFHHFAETNAC